MKNLFFVLFLLVCRLGFAQESKITGSVVDGELKNEPLAFTKISIKNTHQFANTNLEGYYELNIEPGTYTLVYEFAGYDQVEIKDVEVKNKNINLKEVILNAKIIISENNIVSKE